MAVVGLIVLVVAIVLFRRAAATDSPHFRAAPAHEIVPLSYDLGRISDNQGR